MFQETCVIDYLYFINIYLLLVGSRTSVSHNVSRPVDEVAVGVVHDHSPSGALLAGGAERTGGGGAEDGWRTAHSSGGTRTQDRAGGRPGTGSIRAPAHNTKSSESTQQSNKGTVARQIWLTQHTQWFILSTGLVWS